MAFATAGDHTQTTGRPVPAAHAFRFTARRSRHQRSALRPPRRLLHHEQSSHSSITAIEDQTNFKHSRSVGAFVGLTTRRYQSGEIDYDGHISRRGDSHLRGLLYEAATVLLTRSRSECDLRKRGLQLWERLGFKRAAVAVARKLAVIMHSMLITGEAFREKPATA